MPAAGRGQAGGVRGHPAVPRVRVPWLRVILGRRVARVRALRVSGSVHGGPASGCAPAGPGRAATSGAGQNRSRPAIFTPFSASLLSSPAAIVISQSVISPVSGSAAACPRNPSRRFDLHLRVCRASRSAVEITRPGATSGRSATARPSRRSIRQAPRPAPRPAPAGPARPPPRRPAPARLARRAPAHAARHRPGRWPAPPWRPVVPVDARLARPGVIQPAPGRSASPRRADPGHLPHRGHDWVTVSWVATASSNTVESRASACGARPRWPSARSPPRPRRTPRRPASPEAAIRLRQLHQRRGVEAHLQASGATRTFHRRSRFSTSAVWAVKAGHAAP